MSCLLSKLASHSFSSSSDQPSLLWWWWWRGARVGRTVRTGQSLSCLRGWRYQDLVSCSKFIHQKSGVQTFFDCLTTSLSPLTWLLIAMLYYVMWPMSLTNWYLLSLGMTLLTIVSCMVVTLHRLVCQKIKVNSVWINTVNSGIVQMFKKPVCLDIFTFL